MARNLRSPRLETRTERLRLAVTPRPIFLKIGNGLSLGYRRNQTAGTWVVRKSDGKGGNWTRAIGVADDFEEANATADDFNEGAGRTVLTFWEAQARARKVAAGPGGGARTTFSEAVDRYADRLRERGRDAGNATRLRKHLPPHLAKKRVTSLVSDDLSAWRSELLASKHRGKPLSAGTVNRILTTARAALNAISGGHDRSAWREGLAAVEHSGEQDRNIVLPIELVRRIMEAADTLDADFGLFVAVMAQTGARPSQICRIRVDGLSTDNFTVQVPVSRKGRGAKKKTHIQLSVTEKVMCRLRAAADGRPKGDALLTKVKVFGKERRRAPWEKSDHTRLFKKAVQAIADEQEFAAWLKKEQYAAKQVTIYALRHTSIVRQILANVPTRAVAAAHDTSVAMIERTYSRHIDRHATPIVLKSLEDFV